MLDAYRLLGVDRDEARTIVDAPVERGGNFVDTANGYSNDRRVPEQPARGGRDLAPSRFRIWARQKPGQTVIG